jgi:hypothetical protein
MTEKAVAPRRADTLGVAGVVNAYGTRNVVDAMTSVAGGTVGDTRDGGEEGRRE